MNLSEPMRLERPEQLAFMRDVVANQRPVVIRGEMDDWEALSWSPAVLRERCADRLVRVRRGRGVGDDQLHGLLERMDGVLEGPLSELLPGVAHEARVPQFIPRSPLSETIDEPTLWIGAADTTPLHHQPGTESLFQVIDGTVEARMFPMTESGRLYRRSPWHAEASVSPVDAFAPDPQEHPRASEATGLAVELGPGDALYVPPHWWRSLRATGPAIRLLTTWTSLYRPPAWTRSGLALRLGR